MKHSQTSQQVEAPSADKVLEQAKRDREKYERKLTILEHQYGTEHVEVARTLVDLGKACMILGDAKQAKELYERALKIFEHHYGKEGVEVARTLANLGMTFRILGDAKQAKELYERALKIFESHYGTEHVEVARILMSLGTAHRLLRELKQAKEKLERALKIHESHYGTEHVEVARNLVNLGIFHRDAGTLKQAKVLLERALKIFERHPGKGNAGVGVTLYQLADMSLQQGKKPKVYEKALVQCAYDIFLKEHGDNHEYTKMAYDLLKKLNEVKALHIPGGFQRTGDPVALTFIDSTESVVYTRIEMAKPVATATVNETSNKASAADSKINAERPELESFSLYRLNLPERNRPLMLALEFRHLKKEMVCRILHDHHYISSIHYFSLTKHGIVLEIEGIRETLADLLFYDLFLPVELIEHLKALCTFKIISDQELNLLNQIPAITTQKNCVEAICIAREVQKNAEEEEKKGLSKDIGADAAFFLGIEFFAIAQNKTSLTSLFNTCEAFDILPCSSSYFLKAENYFVKTLSDLTYALITDEASSGSRIYHVRVLEMTEKDFSPANRDRIKRLQGVLIEKHAGCDLFDPENQLLRNIDFTSDKKEYFRDILILLVECLFQQKKCIISGIHVSALKNTLNEVSEESNKSFQFKCEEETRTSRANVIQDLLLSGKAEAMLKFINEQTGFDMLDPRNGVFNFRAPSNSLLPIIISIAGEIYRRKKMIDEKFSTSKQGLNTAIFSAADATTGSVCSTTQQANAQSTLVAFRNVAAKTVRTENKMDESDDVEKEVIASININKKRHSRRLVPQSHAEIS